MSPASDRVQPDAEPGARARRGVRRHRDARRFLDKYKRVDIAIDAYYNDPNAAAPPRPAAVSTTKLNQLFDQYKGAWRVLLVVRGA